MSLYADYLKECGHKEIVELDGAFATFIIEGPECYIDDIYLSPALRHTGLAVDLANQVSDVAKSKGCTYLLGTVNTRIKDPTRSIKALLHFGFKFVKSNERMLFFTKDL